ncbi:MAG: ABC transporter ATP-binding protein [Desulfatiglandales bacterium]
MTNNPALSSDRLGKCYQIYDRPIDRLKQSLWRGRKRFCRDFWALKDVSFEIKRGETVGIIGSNGGGKSTLLQVICGILRPTEGSVRVQGKVAALLELGAGFNPEFTGRENVYINAAILGLSRSETDGCFQDIVRFADIGQFIDQPVKSYSSGMYVRLAFAVAVNVSPDILIIDEALAVGDIRFQHKCMARIKAFCERGTVIFVSHSMTAVSELCSRVLWMESGRIRMDGKPRYVIEKYLQYMYEGDETAGRDKTFEDLPANTDPSQMKGFSSIGGACQQFGNLRATIKAVRLVTPEGCTRVLYAGQPCRIDLILHARADIRQPIVGFIVKDRLGRELFGDNNALMAQPITPLASGQGYVISFSIKTWPNIQEDEYLLSLAVADGSLEEHEQCHYIHDALVFKSVPVRPTVGVFSMVDSRFRISEMRAAGG